MPGFSTVPSQPSGDLYCLRVGLRLRAGGVAGWVGGLPSLFVGSVDFLFGVLTTAVHRRDSRVGFRGNICFGAFFVGPTLRSGCGGGSA